MTSEEQHALIGRLYSEKKKLIEDIRLLNARAKEIGKTLYDLGDALQRDAISVHFEGQSIPMEHLRSAPYSMGWISEAELRSLTESLRGKTARLMDVERDLQ